MYDNIYRLTSISCDQRKHGDCRINISVVHVMASLQP